MLIRKAFKFRLYPDRSQQQVLAMQFGHTRFANNHFLAVKRDRYEQTGTGLFYQDTTGKLAVLKREPAHLWLQEADSQVLQQKLKDLDRAYKNFFEGRAGYPRFFLGGDGDFRAAYRGKAVGIDLGLGAFIACSDGRKIANPCHLVQAARRLRRLQKACHAGRKAVAAGSISA